MNPVNATALYVSACRSVLQCDPRDPQSFADLYKLLPFFRQSLSCLVCGNLLQDPIAPTNSSCQHYVCKACKGQKMMMKPSCSWCKDYEQFEENKQLCILVECYRKLCEYIGESPLSQQIASAVGGCPDVLAMLNEGLSLTQREPEDSHISLSLNLSHSLAPSTSEDPCVARLEAPVEVREPPQSAPGVNGLHDCNGLSPVDELARSLSSPEGAAAEVRGSADSELKQSGFPDGLPTCEAVAAGELCADSIDICGFGEDVKHGGGGGALLLSVEEVLRTLEPDPEPDSVVPEDHSCILLPGPGVHGTHNGPSAEPPRQPSLPLDHGVFTPCPPQAPSGISCSAATPRVARPNRKRSRSESDSEKVQPLPISSIIQSPPLAAPAPVAARQEPKVSTAQPVTLVPNGGPPKANKTLLVSSKGVKKNPDHVPKKACSKAKQGVPKAKDKTKDRNPNGTNNGNSNSLIPGSPTKVVYKKPQEKKGCKCGRATQNPSVLTCRGQRCPCYSNRKACLDCICRGCQNSYMANGEKKLEAFAVPEKALEQTRLTLGINVTSIAVRNPGTSSAGVLNVAAGSPVTAFLAASPHEDKGFDETLDMRFDC